LESRKRAPLYQKKQEEELKAAVDKAQECEIRAAEAELNYKEAKVGEERFGDHSCVSVGHEIPHFKLIAICQHVNS